jgi:hypothetical protein
VSGAAARLSVPAGVSASASGAIAARSARGSGAALTIARPAQATLSASAHLARVALFAALATGALSLPAAADANASATIARPAGVAVGASFVLLEVAGRVTCGIAVTQPLISLGIVADQAVTIATPIAANPTTSIVLPVGA